MHRKHGHEGQDVQQSTSIQDREVPYEDCYMLSPSIPLRTSSFGSNVLGFPFEAEVPTSTRRGSSSFMTNKRQRRREDVVEDEDDGMEVEPSDPSGSLHACVESDIATTTDPDEILVQMIQQFASSRPEQGALPRSDEGLSYSQVVEFCRSSGIPLSRMLRLDLFGLCNPQSSASGVNAAGAVAPALNNPSCNP